MKVFWFIFCKQKIIPDNMHFTILASCIHETKKGEQDGQEEKKKKQNKMTKKTWVKANLKKTSIKNKALSSLSFTTLASCTQERTKGSKTTR
jgi:hypothetical protein